MKTNKFYGGSRIERNKDIQWFFHQRNDYPIIIGFVTNTFDVEFELTKPVAKQLHKELGILLKKFES